MSDRRDGGAGEDGQTDGQMAGTEEVVGKLMRGEVPSERSGPGTPGCEEAR